MFCVKPEEELSVLVDLSTVIDLWLEHCLLPEYNKHRHHTEKKNSITELIEYLKSLSGERVRDELVSSLTELGVSYKDYGCLIRLKKHRNKLVHEGIPQDCTAGARDFALRRLNSAKVDPDTRIALNNCINSLYKNCK